MRNERFFFSFFGAKCFWSSSFRFQLNNRARKISKAMQGNGSIDKCVKVCDWEEGKLCRRTRLFKPILVRSSTHEYHRAYINLHAYRESSSHSPMVVLLLDAQAVLGIHGALRHRQRLEISHEKVNRRLELLDIKRFHFFEHKFWH